MKIFFFFLPMVAMQDLLLELDSTNTEETKDIADTVALFSLALDVSGIF